MIWKNKELYNKKKALGTKKHFERDEKYVCVMKKIKNIRPWAYLHC